MCHKYAGLGMKIKDLIVKLQSFDPEARVLVADYYYETRDGFSDVENLDGCIIVASQSKRYHYYGYGDAVLLDTNGIE